MLNDLYSLIGLTYSNTVQLGGGGVATDIDNVVVDSLGPGFGYILCHLASSNFTKWVFPNLPQL